MCKVRNVSFLQKYFLRPQKQKTNPWKTPKNGGKYKWIVLANKIVQVSSKRNVSIKFEENWSTFATPTVQIRRLYIVYTVLKYAQNVF